MSRLGIVVVSVALGLTPRWAAANEQPKAATLIEQGQRLYAKEDYKGAVKVFEGAVRLAPDVSQYHVWLGRAYGRQAENTSKWKLLSALSLARKARESFERAVELQPTNKDALGSLFDFYLEAPGVVGGGIEKAEQLAARIEKAFPADGARSWAAIHEKREEFGRAEEKLRLAHNLEPSEVGHVLSLASFLSRRGRYEESDKFFEEAFRLAPGSPEVWFSRGKALLRAGRNPGEARKLLNRYIQADVPTDAAPRSEARELLKQL
jgi:tetratricopeptide (TPR) repeat protein